MPKGQGMSRGAGRAMGHGLGAGCIVGMWNVLGGLGARVGWVEGMSKRDGTHPDRVGLVR